MEVGWLRELMVWLLAEERRDNGLAFFTDGANPWRDAGVV